MNQRIPARIAFFALALVAGLPAQSVDPGAMIPEDCRVYVETPDLKRLLAVLDAEILRAIATPEAAEARRRLAELSELKTTRAAFAATLTEGRRIILLETPDTGAAIKRLKEFWPKGATLRAGPFAGICDSTETVDAVAETAGRKAKSVRDRDGFAAARRTHGGGAGFAFVDLAGTQFFRFGLAKPKDLGAAFFAAHYLAAAASADSVAMRLDLDGGIKFDLAAPVGKLNADRAFAAPSAKPCPAPLAPPEGVALTASVPRDLAAFWAGRERFMAEDARSGVAEFQNGLSILLGGLAAEDVFAGLGPRIDVYVGPPVAQSPAPRHALPGFAVVAHVPDANLRTELLLGFQTTLGIINADAAQNRKPRFLLETIERDGVSVASARYLQELLPDQDDDRLQLRPSAAFIGERMILGTHPDLVLALAASAKADQAPNSAFEPGDRLRLDGRAAAAVLRAATPFLAARSAIEEGGTVEKHAGDLAFLAKLLDLVPTTTASFVHDGREARLRLDLRAPTLVPVRTGADR